MQKSLFTYIYRSLFIYTYTSLFIFIYIRFSLSYGHAEISFHIYVYSPVTRRIHTSGQDSFIRICDKPTPSSSLPTISLLNPPTPFSFDNSLLSRPSLAGWVGRPQFPQFCTPRVSRQGCVVLFGKEWEWVQTQQIRTDLIGSLARSTFLVGQLGLFKYKETCDYKLVPNDYHRWEVHSTARAWERAIFVLYMCVYIYMFSFSRAWGLSTYNIYMFIYICNPQKMMIAREGRHASHHRGGTEMCHVAYDSYTRDIWLNHM